MSDSAAIANAIDIYGPETRLLAELPKRVLSSDLAARRLVERGYARWMNARPGSRFYRGLLPTPEGRAVVRELAALAERKRGPRP